MQLFLEVGLSKECLQNKHSPLFQGIMFPLTKRQIRLNNNINNGNHKLMIKITVMIIKNQ